MADIKDNKENAEMDEQNEKNTPEVCRTHRVGTITCGITFILYGIMFLLHMVRPEIDYRVIFELWPVILILLGVEILASCTKKNQEMQKYIYDFPAVGLIMAMTFFAAVMAALTQWWRC